MIEWLLPLELISPNIKEHWGKTYARNKRNRRRIEGVWTITQPKPHLPCIISLERQISGKSKLMDDDDNLRMAFKSIKDDIAGLIIPGLPRGKADGDKRLKWQYSQQQTKNKAVRITIEEL